MAYPTAFARITGLAAALLLPGAAFAADLVTEPSEPVPPAVVESGFSGSATFYGWLPWIDGDAGVAGLGPVEVSIDPHELLENLNMTFMGTGDLRWGPVGIFGDLVYMDVGKTEATPGPLFSDATAALSMTIATVAGTYRAYESGGDWLEVMGGARFWKIDGSLDLSSGILRGRSASKTLDWVDPMIGLRGHKEIDAKWFLTGTALVGGFGVGSELTWDVFGGVGYNFTESFAMTAGYRALSVDYEQDGDIIDLVTQGPMFTFTFSF
jgi:opacity protein-like surface antigen